MDVLQSLTLWPLVLIFLICAAIITFAGTKLTYVAEKLAVVTGFGQALTGAVAIGIATSLAGTIVSFYTAYKGHAELSIGTSMGGLPAQTAFLALADLTYRKINIEHASASVENLAQSALLFILLTLPILTMSTPDVTLFSIHPMTPILIAVYLAGLKLIHNMREEPMWVPRKTI